VAAVIRWAAAADQRSDAELIGLAASGDSAAFEVIYRRHAERTFGLLTRLLGPDIEREDLLQETFVRLHAALPRFRGDCSLSTLVYRIATRVVIDHWRRRPAKLTPELDFDSEIAPGLSPAEHADRREAIARAVTLLNKLKPKLRVAFVLREVMDLPHDEVARIVEAHPAAARMRVALAKRALAALASKEDRR